MTKAFLEPTVAVAYHAVSDTWDDSLATSVRDLRGQCELLRDRGLGGVTLQATATGRGRRDACITFDDGLVSVADRAAPVLRELGWPATVFVVTEVLDAGVEIDWLSTDDDAGAAELRCLTWDQLRALAAEGWEIGSHSCTHRLLSALPDAELVWELSHSRERIVEEIGHCSSISYPFGELSGRVMEAARRVGYSRGTGLAGRYLIGNEMAVARVAIARKDGVDGFRRKTSPLISAVRSTPLWLVAEWARRKPSPAELSARVHADHRGERSIQESVASDPAAELEGERLSIASGSLLFFASQIAGNLGYFIAVLLLARTLGPAERGVVAFMTVTALMLGRMSGIGINEAATVFAARLPELRPQLLTTVFVFTGATAAVFGAVGSTALALAGSLTPSGIHEIELVVVGFGVIVAALVNAGTAFLLGLGRFRRQALVMGAGPWSYAVFLLVIAAVSHVTPLRAMIAWSVAHLVFATALFIASWIEVGARRPDSALVRESVAFGYRAWIGNLCRFLNFRTDQLLLGFLGTEAALGLYAVAVNASEMLLYLPSAVGAALIPAVARMAHSERGVTTLRVLRLTMLATAAGVALAAATAPIILPLVFGSRYEHSVSPFMLLLPGAFGFVAISVCSSALVATASPGLSSLGPVVALVSGLVLDFALIPPYGARGAAAAATGAFAAGGIASIWALRKVLEFPLADLLPRRSDPISVAHAARRILARYGALSRG